MLAQSKQAQSIFHSVEHTYQEGYADNHNGEVVSQNIDTLKGLQLYNFSMIPIFREHNCIAFVRGTRLRKEWKSAFFFSI